jgi:hypothetical protein
LSLELASSIVIGLTVAAISINPNLKTSRS